MTTLVTALTFLALGTQSKPGDAPIVAASLFKNGYAFTVREVKATGSDTHVLPIPQYSLGTFWLAANGSAKIDSVLNTSRDIDGTAEAGDIQQILKLNVGAQIEFVDSQGTAYKGALKSVLTDAVVIETAEKRNVILRRDAIRTFTFLDAPKTTSPTKRSERVLRINTTGSGSILLYGLERGLTWAPAYLIDISDPKKLSLTSRTTYLNDLADLKNVSTRLVTGFPSVPFATYSEGITSNMPIAQFLNMLNDLGVQNGQFAGRRESFMNQSAAPGRGGGGGLGTGGELPDPGSSEQIEDLFFYKQDGITLNRGDRLMKNLFQASSDYEHIYTLDLPDIILDENENAIRGGPRSLTFDVWHKLKFKNTAGVPLTTAPATVVANGQILGQDSLSYTSANADVTLVMSKALDVSTKVEEFETGRIRNESKDFDYITFVVDVKGQIELVNRKREAVHLLITKSFSGNIATISGGGSVVKRVKGLRSMNPFSVATWDIKLEPGKSVSLDYTYKVITR